MEDTGMTMMTYFDAQTAREAVRAMHDAEDGVRGTLLYLRHRCRWTKAKASAALDELIEYGQAEIARGRVLLTKHGAAHLDRRDPRVVSQAVPAGWRRDWDDAVEVLRLRRRRRRGQSRDIHE